MAILESPIIELEYLGNNMAGGGLPAFVEVPIYVRQEPGKEERLWQLELQFACQPQMVQGEGYINHSDGGPGLWYRKERPIWINEGVTLPPTDGREQVLGSSRLGCFFRQEVPWFTSEGGAPQFVGNDAFHWIHVTIEKAPRGNWADLKNWHVPCDGLVATVKVHTKYLYPGAYLLNVNAVYDAKRVKKSYLRAIDPTFGPFEIPTIFKCGWLIVKPPSWWPWQIDLGDIVPVDPDGHPFDPFPIPVPGN